MYLLAATLIALGSLAPARGATDGPAARWEYLYDLSDFYGSVEAGFATLARDAETNEVFVASDSVRVFNERGMQSFDAGYNQTLGNVKDVVILPDGRLVALTIARGKTELVVCNFRGEPLRPFRLAGVPKAFAERTPDALERLGDQLFLLYSSSLTVVVTTTDGTFERALDLVELIGFEPSERGDDAVGGFAVDGAGNVLVTFPNHFTAHVIAPDGTVRTFGEPGSKPGKFNVAGAIAADEHGNIFVTDLLRGVVMVFDRGLGFRGEFGYYGGHAGNLNTPTDIVVGGGAVYVAQGANRGVAVFRVEVPTPPQTAAPVTADPYVPAAGASASPTASLVSPSRHKENDR